MAEPEIRKPLLWPMLFIGAFAVGAILWGVWMLVFVRRVERMRPDTTYVQPAPASSNTAPTASNR